MAVPDKNVMLADEVFVHFKRRNGEIHTGPRIEVKLDTGQSFTIQVKKGGIHTRVHDEK